MKLQSLILPALKIALIAVAIVAAYITFDALKAIYLSYGWEVIAAIISVQICFLAIHSPSHKAK